MNDTPVKVGAVYKLRDDYDNSFFQYDHNVITMWSYFAFCIGAIVITFSAMWVALFFDVITL